MITIIYNVIIIIANINKKVAGVLVTGIISLIINVHIHKQSMLKYL